jgi:hypothetical protein
MHVHADDVRPLRFDDGAPVRAASAVVPFGDGWLIAQDDATHAAWVRHGSVTRVRVLPPVEGLDTFEEATGTKHLKPDVESAFAVPGRPGSVVLLGSGSAPVRMRGAVVTDGPNGPASVTADLTPLYARAAQALQVPLELLNLEGACVLGGTLRWFQRGVPSAGVATASVDVDLDGLLAALEGTLPMAEVRLGDARRYDLGEVDGVGLAVTDAVSLSDGSLLVSAAAEDTVDPREDGPVVGSVLAVLLGDAVVASALLPPIEGAVPKIEGLAVVEDRTRESTATGVRLLATVDSDDATAPSLSLELHASW